MIPLPYSIPVYGFIAIMIAGAILRDRWLAAAASLLIADTLVDHWLSTVVSDDIFWAYAAILDIMTATALAWSMRIRGVVIAAALGANVSFYLAIGATKAFGSPYIQSYVAYHAWWGMEYLAFAILGLLAIAGFEDHGGKLVRRWLVDKLAWAYHHHSVARTRPACHNRHPNFPLLESHGAYREAPHSPVESPSSGLML